MPKETLSRAEDLAGYCFPLPPFVDHQPTGAEADLISSLYMMAQIVGDEMASSHGWTTKDLVREPRNRLNTVLIPRANDSCAVTPFNRALGLKPVLSAADWRRGHGTEHEEAEHAASEGRQEAAHRPSTLLE